MSFRSTVQQKFANSVEIHDKTYSRKNYFDKDVHMEENNNNNSDSFLESKYSFWKSKKEKLYKKYHSIWRSFLEALLENLENYIIYNVSYFDLTDYPLLSFEIDVEVESIIRQPPQKQYDFEDICQRIVFRMEKKKKEKLMLQDINYLKTVQSQTLQTIDENNGFSGVLKRNDLQVNKKAPISNVNQFKPPTLPMSMSAQLTLFINNNNNHDSQYIQNFSPM